MVSIQSIWMWEEVTNDYDVAVVIDVYAATTNINIILSQKPKLLIIVNENNYLLAKEIYKDSMLVGESHEVIDFDVSNEPCDIAKSNLEGKVILYMSVNGSKAIEKFSHSKKTISCSINNIRSVASYLSNQIDDPKVLVIKSGSGSKKVTEDLLCSQILGKIVNNERFDWEKLKLEITNAINKFPDYRKLQLESLSEIVDFAKYDIVPVYVKSKEGWLEVL